MDNIDRRLILAGAGLAGFAALGRLAQAGPLDPPLGPVAPTGKTLQEIYDRVARTSVGVAEPRIPVQSLPGSATAVHVIAQSGSYYLTENISGEPGKNGIEIAADGVFLDLSGRAVTGTVGSLKGLRLADFRKRVRICNGSISYWGDGGVLLGNGSECCMLEDLLVGENGGDSGIVAATAAILRCRCDRNAGWGIRGGSLLVDCECNDNSNVGIDANAATIWRCRVAGNFIGFFCGTQAMLSQCVARNNGNGISVFDRARVSGCLVADNTNGIVLGDGSCAEDNQVVGNSGVGINVTGTGAILLRNRAGGNGLNFAIAPGNSHGPIVNVTGIGDISAVPGANHPWANFVY